MLQRTPADLAAYSRVTHRNRGEIPGCVPASDSFKTFDADKYWAGVRAFTKQVEDYIAHMDAVRAGIVAEGQ